MIPLAAKFMVFLFLHTKNLSAVEIYCELYPVYGQNVMSEGTNCKTMV
jgi:hypothetical protein